MKKMQSETQKKFDPQLLTLPPGEPRQPNSDPIMMKTRAIAKMDIGAISPWNKIHLSTLNSIEVSKES